MIVFVKPREMKLRHAAALALVGWYLMLPPEQYSKEHDRMFPDEDAPISQWEIIGSFDTAAQCKTASEQAFSQAGERAREEKRKNPRSKISEEEYDRFYFSDGGNCIATDDPRLVK
jgi:hypothetical protein